jgi:hypothetical protein
LDATYSPPCSLAGMDSIPVPHICSTPAMN